MKRRRASSPYSWFQVRRSMACWPTTGDRHEVPAGAWVRARRGGIPGVVQCEDCLNKVGVLRPARPFTMTAEGHDVRARQVGSDED
jgi:hypothetical protein